MVVGQKHVQRLYGISIHYPNQDSLTLLNNTDSIHYYYPNNFVGGGENQECSSQTINNCFYSESIETGRYGKFPNLPADSITRRIIQRDETTGRIHVKFYSNDLGMAKYQFMADTFLDFNNKGQLISKISDSYFKTNNNPNRSVNHYTYNDQGQLILDSLYIISPDTNSKWRANHYQAFSYYDNGLIKEKYLIKIASGKSVRDSFSYNSSKQLRTHHSWSWNINEWIPQNQEEYIYDTFGNRTMVTYHNPTHGINSKTVKVKTGNTAWILQYLDDTTANATAKTFITYNEKGLLADSTFYEYLLDSSSNSYMWQKQFRYAFAYNQEGNKMQLKMQSYYPEIDSFIDFNIADYYWEYFLPNKEESVEPIVFPNPFGNTFDVLYESTDEAPIHWILHNPMGQKVFQKTLYPFVGTNKLNAPELSFLPTGLYYLSIQQGNRNFMKKVLKEN